MPVRYLAENIMALPTEQLLPNNFPFQLPGSRNNAQCQHKLSPNNNEQYSRRYSVRKKDT